MIFEDIKFLVLWVTGDCNLRCRYCYASDKTDKDYMSFEVAKKAIDLCNKKKIKLQLAGGEPLLNFNLIKEIYDYIKSNDIPAILQMQTNGSLIDEGIAQGIRDMRIAMGVSLDGPIDINEKLRGASSEVLNGIRLLKEVGVMLNLNCVVTDLNIDYLYQLIDIAYYLGNVGGVGLDLLRLTGRAIKDESKVKEASPKAIKDALKRAYLRSMEIEMISGRKIIKREIEEAKKKLKKPLKCSEYCHASYGGSAIVLPNGDLYPCGSLVGIEEYYMGNVLGDNIYKKIRVNNNENIECNDCEYNPFCQGACPARGIINNDGGITEQDCMLRKASFEIAKDCIH